MVMGTDIMLFIDPKNMPKVYTGLVGGSRSTGDLVEGISLVVSLLPQVVFQLTRA